MEKKLKSVPKGEAQLAAAIEKAVEAGKEKVNHISVVFNDGSEVVHEDTKGYSITGIYIFVQLHDDTQFGYPASSIKSFKLFSTNKE